MFANKVTVLGTEYTIEVKKYGEESAFERNGIDGFCEQGTHRIIVGDLHTFPNWENEPEDFIVTCMKHTLRHELVHAFFNESGLQDSADKYNGTWVRNEEMVDWWAIQGEKVYDAWNSAKAL